MTNTLIAAQDVEMIKQTLSETDVSWEGLEGAGKVLTESKWHQGKAIKWMPEELIKSALKSYSYSTNTSR